MHFSKEFEINAVEVTKSGFLNFIISKLFNGKFKFTRRIIGEVKTIQV